MKYSFHFRDDSCDLLDFTCDAKNLVDALMLFGMHVFTNKLSVFRFESYYYVDNNGKKSKRIFNLRLQKKFFECLDVILLMDEVYGIDK